MYVCEAKINCLKMFLSNEAELGKIDYTQK